MGNHSGHSCLLCHADAVDGLGQGTNLIQLNQDGVRAAQLDALGQSLCVGNEQVITDQLNPVAQSFCQQLPAFPILFVQTVFQGNDRILVCQGLPVLYQLSGSELLTALRLYVFTGLGTLPFAGCRIDCQNEVRTRHVTAFLNRLQDVIQSLLVAGQVRCITAFIAHAGGKTVCLQELCQLVIYFRAPAQSFAKTWGTGRHNHKFLCINGIGCVRTTVQNIHHRNRQGVSANTAQIAVQRGVQCLCRCFCRRQGYGQNRIGTELRLVFRAVRFDHRLVDSIGIGSIHSHQQVANLVVHVRNRLGYALSAIPALIAVSQLQRFELTGGCAARASRSAHGSVYQMHLCLHCRISSGVNNLSSNDFFNF